MIGKMLTVGFFAAFGLLCCAADDRPAPALTAQLAANGSHGVRLQVDRLPLSYGGRVSCVAPGWKEAYFRSIPYPGRDPIEVTKDGNSLTQRIPARPDTVAELQEYSVRWSGAEAVITTRIAMLQDRPAVVEHCALILNPRAIAGSAYELVTADGRTRSGVISGYERTDAATSLLPPFTRAVFRGDTGILTVEVLEGEALSMEDRRTRNFSAYGKTFLILTKNGEVSAARPWRQVVRVAWDNPAVQPAAAFAAATTPAEPVERLASDAAPPFPLLPMPTECRESGGSYRPEAGDRLVVRGGGERLMRHAGRFGDLRKLKTERGSTAPERGIFVSAGDDDGDESYTLSVKADGVAIRAGSERGAFYALQTLRGLERDGAFRGVEIKDRPDFRLRAIHAMADSGAREHLGNLIEKVLAPLKINTIILECPYVHWAAMAGQHHPKGMSKAQLAELLAVARENFIEVYPLIPTMSHSEWFFYNSRNLEMLDNPKDRRSYHSLHPGVYPLLARLFDEVIEAFGRPKYFHISHDELIGDHPVHPEGRKVGIAKLLQDDLMWHYRFFKERGIEMMMWQDMLVSKRETNPVSVANARGGTEKLRAGLPKDIVVCVWNYDNRLNGEYPEVDRFVEDGFPVVGAGWFGQGNLEALSRKCLRSKALGMIVTTWHNKFDSELLLNTQYRQITSYIRAASLFWNAAHRTERFDAAQVLVDLLAPSERAGGETMRPLPLRANLELASRDVDFSAIGGDTVRCADGVVFQLARHNGRLAGCSVRSLVRPDLPDKVRVPVKSRAGKLYLLHSVLNETLNTEGRTVKLVVRYADGSLEAFYPRNSIDIGYGSVPVFKDDGKPVTRIYEVGTPSGPYTRLLNHRNVFEWPAPNGRTGKLWYLEWTNPHPDKIIDHLLIEARNRSAVYALLGLTAAE